MRMSQLGHMEKAWNHRTAVNPDDVFLLTNMPAGRYTLEILTAAGKVLYAETIEINAGKIYRTEIQLS